jgi:GAF domain-containing protein
MEFEMSEVATKSQTTDFFWQRLWDRLTAPSNAIADPSERRVARLAASSLLVIASFAVIVGIARIPMAGLSFLSAFAGSIGYTLLSSLVSYALARTKAYRAAIFLFSLFYSATAYVSMLAQGPGAPTVQLILIYVPLSLIVTSTFLSPWAVFFLTGLNVGALITLRSTGFSVNDLALQAAMISLIGFVLILLANFRGRLEGYRVSELETTNRNLEDLTATLEQRVTERTLELEKSNQQVSRRAAQLQAITKLAETIAQVQDLNAILPAATSLISEYFGFYHVGIFLIDDAHEYAILQAANSEGGKQMLERNHRLRLGVGVVGYAAQTGIPRIALDVGADAVFFDNPDLPQTRSEAAIPMNSHGEIIGILDVQSTQAGAFTSEDLQTLTALGNQVAISLENTRLLTETRAALTQVQEVYDEFTRAEWSRTIAKAAQLGFRFNGGRVEMLDQEIRSTEVVEAIRSGEIVKGSGIDSTERHNTVAVPVKVRGEIIGVIHVEPNDPTTRWLESDISLVAAVAERAAFAMENARLFQDARRRAAKEQAISEATARISSATDIENILHTTAEELERVLGGSEVLIQFQGKE